MAEGNKTRMQAKARHRRVTRRIMSAEFYADHALETDPEIARAALEVIRAIMRECLEELGAKPYAKQQTK